MDYCVYKHTCPNGKVYVGITSMNPIDRWNNGKGYNRNQHFYNAILKYGWDNIKHEILFTDLTKEEACEKEIELIAKYKSHQKEFGYNMSNGGYVPSEEMKDHLRRCNLGKCHSEETRKKMSNSRKGKVHSKNHALKISQSLTGRKLSEENKKHLSESKKGTVPWNKGMRDYHTSKGKPVIQLTFDGKFVERFHSSHEASRITGLSQGNIYSCCNGKRNHTGGYIWKWEE